MISLVEPSLARSLLPRMWMKLFVRQDADASNGCLTVTRAIDELIRNRTKMSMLDQRVLHLYATEYTSVDMGSCP